MCIYTSNLLFLSVVFINGHVTHTIGSLLIRSTRLHETWHFPSTIPVDAFDPKPRAGCCHPALFSQTLKQKGMSKPNTKKPKKKKEKEKKKKRRYKLSLIIRTRWVTSRLPVYDDHITHSSSYPPPAAGCVLTARNSSQRFLFHLEKCYFMVLLFLFNCFLS